MLVNDWFIINGNFSTIASSGERSRFVQRPPMLGRILILGLEWITRALELTSVES